MGNVFDVVLTAPFPEYDPARLVENGLRELSFVPATDTGGHEERCVWLRLGHKMPSRMGWDAFKDAVLALPWRRERVPVHLQVLWRDDYTDQDDSWGGRMAPYSWNHETWEVPKR